MDVDIEQLVALITKEVMVYLQTQEAERRGDLPAFRCYDCGQGRCVWTCTDKVRRVMDAGATRVAASLGAAGVATDIARLIDHTLLKPDATPAQIAQLCYEAQKYGFASVCINPSFVALAAQLLAGSPVKVCTVVGFPLGATSTEAKVAETVKALEDGATEIDMVINIGALKAGDYELVERDIAAVVQAAHARGALVKVIIEAALLADEEKVKACTLAKAAGADYVKTSTGFGPGGATTHDVALMRRTVGAGMGVKAAGGIKTLEQAREMVHAGATRIGASAGVRIVQQGA
jgi:deoxyribose-phosphate aldolase